MQRQGRPPAGRHRPVLDPRPASPRSTTRSKLKVERDQLRRHAGDRDARLLREAAHHGRLEGPDQRPLPRRQLPHRRGPAHRAPAADRHQPAGHAGGQRVPRRDLAAVHRRPDLLGRDRRAHHREPGAPRAGLGPVGADRLQERHRRQHPDRDRRDPGRGARPHHFLSVHKNGQVAIVETRGNQDCHVILRGGKAPNYDAASVAAACEELEAAKLPPHADGRLQPRQQQQAARAPGRRGARHRRRRSRGGSRASSA